MLGGTNSSSQSIVNLDVTLTENGTFVSGPGYTGFGTVTVDVPPDVMEEDLYLTPTSTDVISIPSWDEYTGPFEDSEHNQFDGAGSIKVRKVSAWIDSNISADNIRKGQTILGVSGNVIELLPETRTVKSTTSQYTITPNTGYNAISSVTVQPLSLQSKTHITPKSYSVTVYKDNAYDGMSSVQIDAVTAEVDNHIIPSNIKKNVTILGVTGTYDNYVAPVVQPLSVSPTTSQQVINTPSGVDGFNKVTVDPVTSAIDSNIRPENIKRDIEILGIVGTYRIENLQNKTVDPQAYIQNVTFDSALGYEGLGTVTINAVTSSVDANIQSGNIKKDIEILGVTGTYDPQPNIQSTVTVTPTTLQQSVTPDQGYDGLGRVDINAVTSSIDPNILAENIKKNITILGVTGSYEDLPNYQTSKTVEPVTSGDIDVTPDSGYDALLKVIVKAVTASIDPNIMPRNIRKNVSILGIVGSMEEGGEQKWFDFSDISSFAELNQDAWGEGGPESIPVLADGNDYVLTTMINDTFPNISNINAIMFTQVYGYSEEEIEDPIVKECYINFVDGYLYQDYSTVTFIPNQIRYFYPYNNDYGVKGLTIGLDNDDGSARIMKLYVIVDSTKNNEPIPVLVNGNMSTNELPEDYDEFRYIKDVVIPAHDVYIPKFKEKDNIQWVLRGLDTVRTKIETSNNEPDNILVSAYDRDYGTQDTEINTIIGYRLRHFNNLALNNDTLIASQIDTSVNGTILIPGDITKEDQSYYYFAFKPSVYNGSNTYHTVAKCEGLFQVGFYRNSSDSYYRPAWISSWSSTSAGTWSNNSTSGYRMYNGTTYYFRIYVNGTTTTIDWSNDGTTWVTMGTVTSEYIDPLNTNQIEIYAKSGPNTKLCADGIYIKDSSDNIIYSVLAEKIGKQTSHEIVDLDDHNLFVQRSDTRISPYYQGDEILSYSSYNSTTNSLNFGKGGSLIIQRGFNTTGKTWQINLHCMFDQFYSDSNKHLFTWYASKNDNRKCVLWLDTARKLNLRIYTNNSSTIMDGTLSSTTLVLGRDYYIQAGWNGYQYYVYCSTYPNFENYTILYTKNTTDQTYSEDGILVLGNYFINNSYDVTENGSMNFLYLDEYTNVVLDNKIIWQPLNKELQGNIVNYIDLDGAQDTLDVYLAQAPSEKILTNTTILGDLKISPTGIASRFTPGSLLRVDTFYPASGDTWEICLKVTTSSDVTHDQYLFGNYVTNQTTPQLTIDSSKLKIWLSSNGSSWNIANGTASTLSIEPNTTYIIKAYFTGSAYKVDVNDVNYITVASSTSLYFNGKPLSIGYDWYNGAFRGSMDLNECYIKVNNNIVWQPDLKVVNKYDWIFTKDPNWSYSGLTNLGKKAEILIPEHSVYRWDQDEFKWIGAKKLILNVDDSDAILYTEIVKN